MSQERTAVFLDGLQRTGLVPPDEVDAFAAAASRPGASGEDLARDLVRRGLLTGYQARQIWKGRGGELTLGQYLLLDKLGEGGMGEVFKAKHVRMDRVVALKVIRRERLDNAETVKRFQREIRAAASLLHENVVMAYDADQVGDIHVFAMEYVDGMNLARMALQRHPLPIGEVCDYVRQSARALAHIHEKGLTHRDIKPSNLLVGKDGVVKLSDLGLARIDESAALDSVSRITKEGLVVGTPDFVSPEQARNAGSADIRSDIYSLGCTLYYLLAAEVPYPGGTPTEKMLRHQREPLPAVRRDDLPDGLKAVLAKMTAKKPEDRYADPDDLIEELEPFVPKKAAPTMPVSALMPAVDPLSEDDPYSGGRTGDPGTDSRFRLPSADDQQAVAAASFQSRHIVVVVTAVVVVTVMMALVLGLSLWNR